jgi:16S rRNA processing protein RimM
MTDTGQIAGSPHDGEPAFLVVGKLRRPHGLRGEMLMDLITDFPERIQPGVLLYAGDRHQSLRVRSRRLHNNGLLVAFDGYIRPESVAEFRNFYVYVRGDDRPGLQDGDYYHHQILGLKVVEEEGKYLGIVTDILETGVNDVFAITMDNNQVILIPYIDSIVQSINLDEGEIIVHLLPGILPETPSKKAG